ncbi:MAG: FlgD immunoglobulin-like domain containing protein [Candidatus Zixiibacteriota bacterium]
MQKPTKYLQINSRIMYAPTTSRRHQSSSEKMMVNWTIKWLEIVIGVLLILFYSSNISAQTFVPGDTLKVLDVQAFTGDSGVSVTVELKNSIPTAGFSLRLVYDPHLVTPHTTYGDSDWAIVVAHRTDRSSGLGILQGVVREPGVLTFVGAVDWFPGYEYVSAGSGPVVEFEFAVNPSIPQDTVTYIMFENDPEHPSSYNNFSDTLGSGTYIPTLIGGTVHIKRRSPQDTLRVVDGVGEEGEAISVFVDLCNSVDVGGFSLRLAYDPDLLTPRSTYGDTGWVVMANRTDRSSGLGIFQGVVREPGILTFIGAVDWFPGYEYVTTGCGPVVEFEFTVNPNIPQDTITYIMLENDPEYPLSYNSFSDTLGQVLYVPHLINGNFSLKKSVIEDTLKVVDGSGEEGEIMSVFVDLCNSVDAGGFSLRLIYDPDLLTPRTTYEGTDWVVVSYHTDRSSGLGIFQGVVREPGILTFIGAVDWLPGYEYVTAGCGPVVEFKFLVNPNIPQDTVSYIVFENDPEHPFSYNNFSDTLGQKLYVPHLINGEFSLHKSITEDTLRVVDGVGDEGEVMSVFVDLCNSVDVGGFSLRLTYNPDLLTPRTVNGDTNWVVVSHRTDRSSGMGIFQGVVREPGLFTFIGAVDWLPGYEYITAGCGPVVEFEFTVNPNIPQDTVTYIMLENDPEYPFSYNNLSDTLGMQLYIPQLINGNFSLKSGSSEDSISAGYSPPIFEELESSFEINIGHDLQFDVIAHDPDGDSIILSCKSILPQYSEFESICEDSLVKQTFYLKPDSSIEFDTTLYVTFCAQDQKGYSAIKGVEIFVKVEEMTEVDDHYVDASIGKEFSLMQNYPNPFNSNTEIWFSLPRSCDVNINIYNVRGELVKTLAQGNISTGVHRISWDATNNSGYKVTSGIYFCRLRTQAYEKVMKMVLLK